MSTPPPTATMDEELPPLPMPLTPDEEESALLLLIHCNLLMAAAVDTLLPLKKSARKRRVWTWPYLQRRTQFGHYDTLMEELYSENPDLYKNFTLAASVAFLLRAPLPFTRGRHGCLGMVKRALVWA